MEQQLSEQAQPRRRVRRSAEQWASLIAAQADSGLSIEAFCRERGLAVSSFHAWRRRLSAERAEAAATRRFVRLRVADAETASTASSRTTGDQPGTSNTDGDADGCGHGDKACEARPLMVRFADGVEVHVDARQLAEVLTCLRKGSAAGESS